MGKRRTENCVNVFEIAHWKTRCMRESKWWKLGVDMTGRKAKAKYKKYTKKWVGDEQRREKYWMYTVVWLLFATFITQLYNFSCCKYTTFTEHFVVIFWGDIKNVFVVSLLKGWKMILLLLGIFLVFFHLPCVQFVLFRIIFFIVMIISHLYFCNTVLVRILFSPRLYMFLITILFHLLWFNSKNCCFLNRWWIYGSMVFCFFCIV